MKHSVFAFALYLLVTLGAGDAFADPLSDRLALAGDNRDEIARALAEVPVSSREGMKFLVLNMPVRDLQSLSAQFLLENTRLAYLSRQTDPWAKNVPLDIFLNDVLPYASINERRDNWRADFRKRCLPMVKDAKNASEAAAIINQKLFKQIGVKYSTKRVKADQSPLESIEGGLASCTGLSVILIDACRSVGIPARFVGTPMWFNGSGNHSWVEIWDNGWHFTGAAEPTGMELDKGWFVGRAAKADRSSALHAVYATSFKGTPLSFPCVWNPRIKYIPALNVTDRYVSLKKVLPDGFVDALFVVYAADRQRVSSRLRIMDGSDTVFDGKTNDDRFDTNDHLRVPLKQNRPYLVFVGDEPDAKGESITPKKNHQLHSFQLPSKETPPGDAHGRIPNANKASVAPFPHSLVPAKDLPRYSAKRATTPPTIDGRLDDAAWMSCQKTRSFVDLISGEEAMHDTRAAILWDDDYLYIGFWIEEPNVDAKYLKRDDPIYYDNDVEVFIAGKDSYYEFEINAHETVYEGFFVWEDAYLRDGYDKDPQLKQDASKKQIFNGVGFKNHPRGKRLAFLGYDFPNFKSAVHVNGTLNDDSDVDQGWTVELAFPWAEMKWLAKGDNRALPPKPGDKWGIDLFRFNKYKAPKPAVDSGGWALGKHGIWDSHIPEIFPIVTFVEK